MNFRYKLQLMFLPFILIPIVIAGYIYSTVGREMLRVQKSEVLQLRLDSLYQYVEEEFTKLEELGLTNTVFFNKKSWDSVERFAEELQVSDDLLFIIEKEQIELLLNYTADIEKLKDNTGYLISDSDLFPEKKNTYRFFYREFAKWDMNLVSATDEKSIYEPIDNATNLFILFSLGNVIFFIIVMFLLSKGVTAPLIKLTSLAKEMSKNNLSVRAEINSRDEIGMLAANFNTMVERLEISTKSLEEKVESRTKELSQTVQELQLTQKQLVEAEKMASLGSLVAGISHEINTPIGIGITAISYLEGISKKAHEQFINGTLKKSEFDKMFLKCFESISIALKSLHRAGQLISTFKMVAVDQHLEEMRHINLKEQMDSILLTLRPELKKSPVKVHVDVPTELVINSYPGAIWQIMTNIILNALIHAFKPAEKGLINITVEKKDSHIELSISDNGKGIKPSDASKIFDPFYTTRRHQGGTGLGLHIVYNIVTQLLKGTICCNSILGEGTTFIITLP